MDKLKILAPAKINLHLQIISKRNDGFHNLVSLFQMISLYDEIIIEKIDKNKIILNGKFNCLKEDNLIYKAALWIIKTLNYENGFKISCSKNIPMGAGLGGGSSDAAATLLGINALLDFKIDDNLLSKGALELGSDVPFFLGSSTAIAEGRGEKLIPIKTRENYFLLVTDSGFHSSTKEAFEMLNIEFSDIKKITIDDISSAYLSKTPSDWPFLNSFSPFLHNKHSDYKSIINKLNLFGSVFSSITGTGSSVFGVFLDENQADTAKKILKESNIIAHKVKMLANRPKPVYNYHTAE